MTTKMPNISDLSRLTKNEIGRLPDDQFKMVLSELLEIQKADRKENQLIYYVPVSPKSKAVHFSTARVMGLGGGNGSSKTDTCLAEIAMCVTGIKPLSLANLDNKKKFRGPINVRIVCESLTTVLHPIILPKLQWWKWSGVSEPGGDQGHWGWIPKTSLIDGQWEKSWSEKLKILRVLYRNPEDWDQVIGESTVQFMSYDQDPTDFASGDFHIVLHDEPPKYAIWRENEARTMRVSGRLLLAMTWPDDPAIPVDWIFDEIYDRAQPGPAKKPDVEWVNLYTTENRNLNQNSVATQAESWSDEVRRVRIFGEPIRFSNRVHPLFTDSHRWWCFRCKRECVAYEGRCGHCQSEEIDTYCHLAPFEPNRDWPTIFCLDPHPRKPHMFCWVQVDPADDLHFIAEGQADDSPDKLKAMVDELESFYGLYVALRLIDPNMGRSPASTKRLVTWQDEFDAVGLRCDLADDSDVGRSRLNEFLAPDPKTQTPRIRFREGSCSNACFQLKRYVWDDFKASLEKDQKQKPKPKYDDYPTMLKYIMNYEPHFRDLKFSGLILQTRFPRRGNS